MANISKYNKSRFVSYLFGFIPSLCSIFTKRDKNLIVLNSFHNNSFSDNTKFLFEYLKNSENKKILYVVNGAPIKNAGLCEYDVSFLKKIYYGLVKTNLSFVLSTGSVFDDYIARHAGISKKKVLTSSYPRYDPLFNNVYTKVDFGDNSRRVLYAPTWRHYAKVKLFPFSDFEIESLNCYLKEKNIKIYIRIHPRFEDDIPENLLKYSNLVLFSGKQYQDINEYLGNFDALITDYSSIMYDFMILDRPIFYFPYDYDDYLKNVGFGVEYNKFAVGYHSMTQKDFINDLEDAFSKDSYREQRRNISKLSSGESKTNCKDLITQLKERNIF